MSYCFLSYFRVLGVFIANTLYQPPAPLPACRAYRSEGRIYASESGMDNLFFQSVYCLSGLGIVRKNRSISKHFSREKVFVSS